ncbi:hypothetical protein AcW1_009773 [Taiwanofungus camphoratus]|nr:hypothetical protein AcW1_009773 [Antrodia cinnamomea]
MTQSVNKKSESGVRKRTSRTAAQREKATESVLAHASRRRVVRFAVEELPTSSPGAGTSRTPLKSALKKGSSSSSTSRLAKIFTGRANASHRAKVNIGGKVFEELGGGILINHEPRAIPASGEATRSPVFTAPPTLVATRPNSPVHQGRKPRRKLTPVPTAAPTRPNSPTGLHSQHDACMPPGSPMLRQSGPSVPKAVVDTPEPMLPAIIPMPADSCGADAISPGHSSTLHRSPIAELMATPNEQATLEDQHPPSEVSETSTKQRVVVDQLSKHELHVHAVDKESENQSSWNSSACISPRPVRPFAQVSASGDATLTGVAAQSPPAQTGPTGFSTFGTNAPILHSSLPIDLLGAVPRNWDHGPIPAPGHSHCIGKKIRKSSGAPYPASFMSHLFSSSSRRQKHPAGFTVPYSHRASSPASMTEPGAPLYPFTVKRITTLTHFQRASERREVNRGIPPLHRPTMRATLARASELPEWWHSGRALALNGVPFKLQRKLRREAPMPMDGVEEAPVMVQNESSVLESQRYVSAVRFSASAPIACETLDVDVDMSNGGGEILPITMGQVVETQTCLAHPLFDDELAAHPVSSNAILSSGASKTFGEDTAKNPVRDGQTEERRIEPRQSQPEAGSGENAQREDEDGNEGSKDEKVICEGPRPRLECLGGRPTPSTAWKREDGNFTACTEAVNKSRVATGMPNCPEIADADSHEKLSATRQEAFGTIPSRQRPMSKPKDSFGHAAVRRGQQSSLATNSNAKARAQQKLYGKSEPPQFGSAFPSGSLFGPNISASPSEAGASSASGIPPTSVIGSSLAPASLPGLRKSSPPPNPRPASRHSHLTNSGPSIAADVPVNPQSQELPLPSSPMLVMSEAQPPTPVRLGTSTTLPESPADDPQIVDQFMDMLREVSGLTGAQERPSSAPSVSSSLANLHNSSTLPNSLAGKQAHMPLAWRDSQWRRSPGMRVQRRVKRRPADAQTSCELAPSLVRIAFLGPRSSASQASTSTPTDAIESALPQPESGPELELDRAACTCPSLPVPSTSANDRATVLRLPPRHAVVNVDSVSDLVGVAAMIPGAILRRVMNRDAGWWASASDVR